MSDRGEPSDEPLRGERFFEQLPEPWCPRLECDTARAVVAIARTEERYRDAATIHALVKDAVDQLGGMSAFVKPGQRVLIKPNLTGRYLADEGKTTDPRVVVSLIRQAKAAGASEVVVGEGSGTGDTAAVFRATGMAAAVSAAGARWVSFDDCERRTVDLVHAKALREADVPAPLLDADVIINACKGKTHHVDPVSGALENWVGCLPLHHGREEHHDRDCFAAFVDLMTLARPALNVCDAIVVGEGDGPIANTPRWCGCVIASTDPVALDVTLCRLFSLEPTQHRFAAEGAERGLGVRQPDCIDVVGATLEEARIEVRRPRRGWDYFPFNVLVGGGVTYAGTLGHWKSIADAFLADGTWAKVLAKGVLPTFLIGDIEDPDFERHVAQGPYVVIDDAAPERYRSDPRVTFIPGHPVLHDMLVAIEGALGRVSASRTRRVLGAAAGVALAAGATALLWSAFGRVRRSA